MNILCVGDGSDSGYQTASLLARIIDPRQVSKIQIILVAWPPSDSALWRKANELRLMIDDVHQAMEVVVEHELERLRSAFEGHADSTETGSANGEPIDKILEYANVIKADLILLAMTEDEGAEVAHKVSSEVIAKSSVLVVVAHGCNKCAGTGTTNRSAA